MTRRSSALPRIGVFSRALGLAVMPRARHTAFVQGVEHLGYGMLWLSEAFGREAFSHAGVVLAGTERLTVATGIANIWARDATAMTNAARTLAEAYPGRFVLGVGVSHDRLVQRRAQAYDKPLTMLRHYLAEMDKARWLGPPVESAVPRLIGALGPRALELSAEAADGAIPYLVTPEYTASARKVLGDDALLAPEQAVVLSDDPDVARSAARRHLDDYLPLTNYRRSFLRQGFSEDDFDDRGSDRLIDGTLAWGSAEHIAARIRAHHEAGADHVAVQAVPVDEDDDPLRTLRALAPLVVHAPPQETPPV